MKVLVSLLLLCEIMEIENLELWPFQIFALLIVIALNEAKSVQKRDADPQVNLGDILALSIPRRNLQFQRGQPVRNIVRAGAKIRRVQAVSNIARTILNG